MREKLMYIAEDGKEFNDYDECVDYEFNLSLNSYDKSSIIFYDEDCNKIPIDKDNLECLYDNVKFMYVKSEDGFKILDLFYDYDGVDLRVKSTGVYVYDYHDGMVAIDNAKIHNILKFFNEVLGIEL